MVAEDEEDGPVDLAIEILQVRLDAGGLGDVAGDQHRVGPLVANPPAEPVDAIRLHEVQVEIRQPGEAHRGFGHGQSRRPRIFRIVVSKS